MSVLLKKATKVIGNSLLLTEKNIHYATLADKTLLSIEQTKLFVSSNLIRGTLIVKFY